MCQGDSENPPVERHPKTFQQIESAETQVAGLVHDFNNSLVTIMGISDAVKRRYGNDSDIVSNMDRIMYFVAQSSKLARRMLSYSRQQYMEPVSLQLNTVVINLRGVLENIYGKHIKITTLLCENLPNVFADSAQVVQVLMNLCLNAINAMPEGGELILETELEVIDKEVVDKFPYMKEGRYVLLSVSDTGTGMDENTISRAFDPFFTTRKNEGGTGLGLSMTYGIIKQHNGFIHITSQLEKGTTVRVHLPVFENYGLGSRLSLGEKRGPRRDDPKVNVT